MPICMHSTNSVKVQNSNVEGQSQKLIEPKGGDNHINSSYLLTKFLPERCMEGVGLGRKVTEREQERREGDGRKRGGNKILRMLCNLFFQVTLKHIYKKYVCSYAWRERYQEKIHKRYPSQKLYMKHQFSCTHIYGHGRLWRVRVTWPVFGSHH